jgi:Mrp family chromosome partitioning ATPase
VLATGPIFDGPESSKGEETFLAMFRRVSKAGMNGGADGGFQTRVQPSRGQAAWSRPVRQILATADQAGARVIGITASRSGSGTSTIAQELAKACAMLQHEVILVDASSVKIDLNDVNRSGREPIDLEAFATKCPDGYFRVPLEDVRARLPFGRKQLQDAFAIATARSAMIVVDLPPIVVDQAIVPPGLLAAGPACDQVYLICRTGTMPESELRESVQLCRIADVKLGGLILNDGWHRAANLMNLTV